VGPNVSQPAEVAFQQQSGGFEHVWASRGMIRLPVFQPIPTEDRKT